MSDKITPIRSTLRNAREAEQPPGGGHLPDGCPVIPLGFTGGEGGGTCHYLNSLGQYASVPAKQHSKLTIYGLFGERHAYLIGPFQWGKSWDDEQKKFKDFAPDKVARDLIAACQAEGPFTMDDVIRGRGAWLGEDDDLVLHLGRAVMAGGQSQRPGKRGRHIYTVQPERPAPAREPQSGGEDSPAYEIEALLKCWSYRRPDVDARLLLGWICASYLCGALTWRPAMWIVGPRGSGKSTLLRLVGAILAPGEGCHVTADATAAGLRTRLGHDALPVLFDDHEPSEDNQKLTGLIEQMVRLAASGGTVLRGTADHGSAAFTVRFMALFNSILRPTLRGQDQSRITFLSLVPATDGRPPKIAPEAMRLLGRRLFRRMVDAWPRFREALQRWHQALTDQGLENRVADQYGVLLAAADVALHDDMADSDTLADWAERIARGTLTDRREDQPEWQRCLEHIRTSIAPQWRGGELANIGQQIAKAAGRAVVVDTKTQELVRPGLGQMEEANRALSTLGLKVVISRNQQGHMLRRHLAADGTPRADLPPTPAGAGDPIGLLAVANSHAALNGQVFRGSHWQARSGTAGGWKAALEDAPGATIGREMRFGGPASRCVLVPLDLVLDGQMDQPE